MSGSAMLVVGAMLLGPLEGARGGNEKKALKILDQVKAEGEARTAIKQLQNDFQKAGKDMRRVGALNAKDLVRELARKMAKGMSDKEMDDWATEYEKDREEGAKKLRAALYDLAKVVAGEL